MNETEQRKTKPSGALCRSERVVGCLLGGAVGDALGAPIEFMTLPEIRKKFGPEGLKDYSPAYGRLANGDFDLRDEDLAAHQAGSLRRVSRLEEKLEGLLEIRANLLEL
jgi:ADP-ribosylglycohydrolase